MGEQRKTAQQWLEAAVSGIRFTPDRLEVERELRGHLEDKIADLGRIFHLDHSQAEKMALEQMGDAEQIGRELAKVHRPWLGYLWHASRWLAWVALCLLAAALCVILLRGELVSGLQEAAEEWNENREGKAIAQVLYQDAPLESLEKFERYWDGWKRLALYDLGRETRLGEATVTLSQAALWQTGEGRTLFARIRVAYDRARDKSEMLMFYLCAEDSLGNHYGHKLEIHGSGTSMSGFGFAGKESHWSGWTWDFEMDDVPEEAEWVRFYYALRPDADLGFFIDLREEGAP